VAFTENTMAKDTSLPTQILRDAIEALSRLSDLADETASKLALVAGIVTTEPEKKPEPPPKDKETPIAPPPATPTWEQVEAATRAAAVLNREAVVAALKAAGVSRAKELQPAQWADYLKALEVDGGVG